jgi:hypothetical protein
MMRPCAHPRRLGRIATAPSGTRSRLRKRATGIMYTAAVSVASMPLDLDVPRYYATLDDISPDEGRPLSPPPEIVAHLEEAREFLAAAGVDSKLTSAAGEPGHEIAEVARRVRSALSSTSLQRRCSVVCNLRAQAKELLGSRVRNSSWGQVVFGGGVPPEATRKAISWPFVKPSDGLEPSTLSLP